MSCATCRAFDADPGALEAALPLMRALSSALAATRRSDGLCRVHDRLTEADSTCSAKDLALPVLLGGAKAVAID